MIKVRVTNGEGTVKWLTKVGEGRFDLVTDSQKAHKFSNCKTAEASLKADGRDIGRLEVEYEEVADD